MTRGQTSYLSCFGEKNKGGGESISVVIINDPPGSALITFEDSRPRGKYDQGVYLNTIQTKTCMLLGLLSLNKVK